MDSSDEGVPRLGRPLSDQTLRIVDILQHMELFEIREVTSISTKRKVYQHVIEQFNSGAYEKLLDNSTATGYHITLFTRVINGKPRVFLGRLE